MFLLCPSVGLGKMAKTILIVDDDPKNLELFGDLLRVVGYMTIEATDGMQGIELARTRQPDLILMDIQMPIMDGYQAIRTLKGDASTWNIPVIALTSYAMKGDKEKILAMGCDGYMAKPIDVDGFLESVAAFITDKGDGHK